MLVWTQCRTAPGNRAEEGGNRGEVGGKRVEEGGEQENTNRKEM